MRPELWVALDLAVLIAWWSALRERPWRGALVVLAWVGVAWGWIGPRIPVRFLTLMHEGGTLEVARNVVGLGAHGGPHLQGLLDGLAGGEASTRDAARLGVTLMGVDAALIAWIARLAGLGSVGAGLAAAGWLGSVGLHNAALSETPSLLMATLVLMAVPCQVQALQNRGGRGIAAVGVVAVLAGLLAATREEQGVLGAAALGGLALEAALGDPGRARLQAGVTATLGALRGWRGLALGLAVLLAVRVSWGPGFIGWRHPWPPLPIPESLDRWGWALQALHPTNGGLMLLPMALLAIAGPGLVVLVAAGLRACLRRPVATLPLWLATLYLFRAYSLAAHAGEALFEIYRYTLLLAGPVAVLAVAGARELPRRAAIVAGLLTLLPAWPVPLERFVTVDGDPGPALPRVGLLDRDLQREARALFRVVEEHPGCVVQSRARRWGPAHQGGLIWLEDRLAAIPTDDGQELVMGVRGPLSAEALERAVEDAPCLLFFEGLGCHRREGPDCGPRTGEPIFRETSPSRPYVHPQHGLATEDPVALGLWRVR